MESDQGEHLVAMLFQSRDTTRPSGSRQRYAFELVVATVRGRVTCRLMTFKYRNNKQADRSPGTMKFRGISVIPRGTLPNVVVTHVIHTNSIIRQHCTVMQRNAPQKCAI